MTARQDGWETIVKVEPEIMLDQNGRPEYEIVWIVVEDGTIFSRELGHGEELEDVVRYYVRRGHTDDECIFFR